MAQDLSGDPDLGSSQRGELEASNHRGVVTGWIHYGPPGNSTGQAFFGLQTNTWPSTERVNRPEEYPNRYNPDMQSADGGSEYSNRHNLDMPPADRGNKKYSNGAPSADRGNDMAEPSSTSQASSVSLGATSRAVPEYQLTVFQAGSTTPSRVYIPIPKYSRVSHSKTGPLLPPTFPQPECHPCWRIASEYLKYYINDGPRQEQESRSDYRMRRHLCMRHMGLQHRQERASFDDTEADDRRNHKMRVNRALRKEHREKLKEGGDDYDIAYAHEWKEQKKARQAYNAKRLKDHLESLRAEFAISHPHLGRLPTPEPPEDSGDELFDWGMQGPLVEKDAPLPPGPSADQASKTPEEEDVAPDFVPGARCIPCGIARKKCIRAEGGICQRCKHLNRSPAECVPLLVPKQVRSQSQARQEQPSEGIRGAILSGSPTFRGRQGLASSSVRNRPASPSRPSGPCRNCEISGRGMQCDRRAPHCGLCIFRGEEHLCHIGPGEQLSQPSQEPRLLTPETTLPNATLHNQRPHYFNYINFGSGGLYQENQNGMGDRVGVSGYDESVTSMPLRTTTNSGLYLENQNGMGVGDGGYDESVTSLSHEMMTNDEGLYESTPDFERLARQFEGYTEHFYTSPYPNLPLDHSNTTAGSSSALPSEEDVGFDVRNAYPSEIYRYQFQTAYPEVLENTYPENPHVNSGPEDPFDWNSWNQNDNNNRAQNGHEN